MAAQVAHVVLSTTTRGADCGSGRQRGLGPSALALIGKGALEPRLETLEPRQICRQLALHATDIRVNELALDGLEVTPQLVRQEPRFVARE